MHRAGRHNAEGKCSIDSCGAAGRLTFDHRRSNSQGKSTAKDQVAIYPPAASEIRARQFPPQGVHLLLPLSWFGARFTGLHGWVARIYLLYMHVRAVNASIYAHHRW